jgi:hypothetical protein
MSEPLRRDSSEEISSNNILRITDELVRQVDQTKKLVVIMLLVVVIAVPVSWHLAPLITSSSPGNFRIAGYVTIAVAIAFIGIGIRQWLQLSKWTKKYRLYKEMQSKVDAELDFDDGHQRSS